MRHNSDPGVGEPHPPPLTQVQYSFSVGISQRLSVHHIPLQEGIGAEAPALGGVGGTGVGRYGVQGLWPPSHNCIILQIPSEGDRRLGWILASVGV